MNDKAVRDLFLAEASDAALGASTVDVDAVVSRERRSLRRNRAGVGILLTAAAVATLATGPNLAKRWAGGREGPNPTGTAPSATYTAPDGPLTDEERDAIVAMVLREHFPGAVIVPLPTGDRPVKPDGGWAMAQLREDGQLLVTFTLAVSFYRDGPVPRCGELREVCSRHNLADGSVVDTYDSGWVDGARLVYAQQIQPEDRDVELSIGYRLGAREYPLEQLVEAVTDWRLQPR